MSAQLALLPGYLVAHLQLTLVALLLGIAISVPMGVVLTRVRSLEQPVLAVAGVIQTVPSLALLAAMVPLLAALGLRSIGALPALIGLVLYSVLPILRNTVTGLAAVSPVHVEAADGVGMTDRQRLWLVELPLAMPVIVAGIRTATVWTVGVATLSTPVGATSLGNYIFSGLQTRNLAAIGVGCVAAAALALLLDGLVRTFAVGLASHRRGLVLLSAAGFGFLSLWAGAAAAEEWFSGRAAAPVRIGAKTFTEQYILADILAQTIEHGTGAKTEVVSSLGSTVAFDALRTGQIDLYVDYDGTIWSTIMKAGAPDQRADVLAQVGAYLENEHGIDLICPLGFENAYALAVRRDGAEAWGATRISDLTPRAPSLSIGGDYEFFARPEWVAVRDTYGLRFASQRSMDASLMYQAVAASDVDVISAFTTDGRIAAFDLQVLADDRGAIPPYDAILLTREAFVGERPEVVGSLRGLCGGIDTDEMRGMNRAVDVDGDTPADVARKFLLGLEPAR